MGFDSNNIYGVAGEAKKTPSDIIIYDGALPSVWDGGNGIYLIGSPDLGATRCKLNFTQFKGQLITDLSNFLIKSVSITIRTDNPAQECAGTVTRDKRPCSWGGSSAPNTVHSSGAFGEDEEFQTFTWEPNLDLRKMDSPDQMRQFYIDINPSDPFAVITSTRCLIFMIE